MGLKCLVCGVEFEAYEHNTELCDDDICRSCHPEDYTFEDCWMHHRKLASPTYFEMGGGNDQIVMIVEACPRCGLKSRMTFTKFFTDSSGHWRLRAKCHSCSFHGESE